MELAAEPPEPSEREDDAADKALAKIGTEEVERVLELLSPDQRAVLLLRVIGDLSVEDVAKARRQAARARSRPCSGAGSPRSSASWGGG